MKFKHFVESKDQVFLDAILKFSESHPNLPKPTTLMDTGSSGYIFNTTDPNIVIRIGPDERECESQLERLQNTGGVVKILLLTEFPVGENHFMLTWKEKVNEFVDYFIRKNYPDKFEEIMNILANLYMGSTQEEITTLSKFAPTKGLEKQYGQDSQHMIFLTKAI